VGGETGGGLLLRAEKEGACAEGCGFWEGGEAQGALGEGPGEHGCGLIGFGFRRVLTGVSRIGLGGVQ
jgi:hypothetical protein